MNKLGSVLLLDCFWSFTGLLLLLATSCIHGNQNGCSFPEFLQTERNNPWYFNLTRSGIIVSPDSRIHYITFENELMQTSVFSADHGRFNRTCLKAKGNNKFILNEIRENDPDNTRFLCMKFIPNSKNVVEMEVSEYASSPYQDLCNHLQLEERPLVRHANTPLMCPVVGGFNMKVYTPEGKPLCHEAFREARMESNCMKDNFLQFNFASCNIKDVIFNMRELQNLNCIGSWQSGENTFVILSTRNLLGIWCLRYPTNHGDEFDAFLFSDVCKRSQIFHQSTMYARLRLERKVYDVLCNDFSEDCETKEKWFTCTTEWDNNLGVIYCKKKCNLCAEDDGTNCEFGPGTLGTWLPLGEQPFDNITLSNTASLLPLGKMSCKDSIKYSFENDKRILTSYSSDGCYPRFYCFFAKAVSPSVLVYKMLPGPKWPEYPYYCSHSMFIDENRDFEFFVNKWSPTLSQNPPEAVACKIPEVAYVFESSFEDGVTCSGLLYKPDCLGEEANRITLSYQKCNNESYETSVNLTCHGHIPDENYQLVRDEASGSFYCLHHYFSELFIMPANKCNSMHRIVRLTMEVKEDSRCTEEKAEEEHLQVEVSTSSKHAKEDIPTTIKPTGGALPQKTSQTFCGVMVPLLLVQIFIFSE